MSVLGDCGSVLLQERIKADEAMELISLQQQLDGRVEVNPRDEL